ncbi:MAG TPA: hypothetical protein VLQ89_06320, partial [Candidatus Binatia bacterium]|nr:hypothetical protein [Candidatus Binatia bacterium]
MRPPHYYFIALLLATAACGHPALTLVPEVSPPLRQEEVFALTGQAAGNILFPCAAGIGWVEAAGRIATWDPEKKAAGTVQHLPFAVSEPPFVQNGVLALHDPAARQLAVFDLARMENRFMDKDSPARKVLGVDGEHVVYLDGENLVVHHWPAPPVIHR